jgi:hypothetical protein
MIRTPLEIPIQLRTGVSANSAQLVRQKDGDFRVAKSSTGLNILLVRTMSFGRGAN